MLSSVVVVTFALLVLLLPASGSQASSLSALRGSAFVARGLRPSASTPLRHRCVHDLLQVSPTIVPTAQHRRQDAPHSWQPIVVAIDETVLTTAPVDVGYTCYATNDTFAGGTPCGAQDVVSESAVQFLSAVVLPTLRDIAQLLLAVDRPTADADYRVQLASTCNRIPVRDEWQSPGTSADFTLFATLRAHPSSSNRESDTLRTLATAAPCMLGVEQQYRPIAGVINFNPAVWREVPVSDEELDARIDAALHELIHALGFTASVYSRFLSTPISTSVEQGANGIPRTLVTTPRVVEWVRHHFNCDQLLGAELENFNGVLGSHWEERLFADEIMTGVLGRKSLVSALTIAFLEDSGWYRLRNGVLLDEQPFGASLGCPFATQPCGRDSWPSQLGYWCEHSGAIGCAPGFRAKAPCDLVTFSSAIPAPYRYFPEPTRGGMSEFGDFCPTFNDDHQSSIFCADTTVVDGGELRELHGSSSYCLPVMSTGSATNNENGGCFEVRFAGTHLTVANADGDTMECPSAGGYGALGRAQIYCPSPAFLLGNLSSLRSLPPPSAFFGQALPPEATSDRAPGFSMFGLGFWPSVGVLAGMVAVVCAALCVLVMTCYVLFKVHNADQQRSAQRRQAKARSKATAHGGGPPRDADPERGTVFIDGQPIGDLEENTAEAVVRRRDEPGESRNAGMDNNADDRDNIHDEDQDEDDDDDDSDYFITGAGSRAAQIGSAPLLARSRGDVARASRGQLSRERVGGVSHGDGPKRAGVSSGPAGHTGASQRDLNRADPPPRVRSDEREQL